MLEFRGRQDSWAEVEQTSWDQKNEEQAHGRNWPPFAISKEKSERDEHVGLHNSVHRRRRGDSNNKICVPSNWSFFFVFGCSRIGK